MTPCSSLRPLNLRLIDLLLLRDREWLLRFFFLQTGFSLLAAALSLVSPSPPELLMAKSTLMSDFPAAVEVLVLP